MSHIMSVGVPTDAKNASIGIPRNTNTIVTISLATSRKPNPAMLLDTPLFLSKVLFSELENEPFKSDGLPGMKFSTPELHDADPVSFCTESAATVLNITDAGLLSTLISHDCDANTEHSNPVTTKNSAINLPFILINSLPRLQSVQPRPTLSRAR